MEAPKRHEIDRDRLSNLPDPVIHHILSFLDMKYVIPTSMLSRRWRNLWYSLPFLSFSDYEFRTCLLYDSYSDCDEEFSDFVNMVMLRRDSSVIQYFNLIWNDDSLNRVDQWIRTAVLRNVKEINVKLVSLRISTEILEFPDCLFTSKSLTSLSLGFAHLYSEPKVLELPDTIISLPSLKSLYLESFDLSAYDNFFDTLFIGCPALESLSLLLCRITRSNISTISSLQLKQLRIDMLPSANDQLEAFVIRASNLLEFTWTSSLSWSAFSLEGLSSIVTADIHPGDCYDFFHSSPNYYYCKDSKDLHLSDSRAVKGMMECLKALCSVKHLTLSSDFLQLISELPSELDMWRTTFSNLRYLNLRTWLTRGCFQVTMFLLKNSPNIETLVLRMHPQIESEKPLEHERESSFNLKLHHLKVVKLLDVSGCKNELQHLRILLGNAEVLEKIIIVQYWPRVDNAKEWNFFTADVLTLPRVSPDVRINFRTKYEDA